MIILHQFNEVIMAFFSTPEQFDVVGNAFPSASINIYEFVQDFSSLARDFEIWRIEHACHDILYCSTCIP